MECVLEISRGPLSSGIFFFFFFFKLFQKVAKSHIHFDSPMFHHESVYNCIWNCRASTCFIRICIESVYKSLISEKTKQNPRGFGGGNPRASHLCRGREKHRVLAGKKASLARPEKQVDLPSPTRKTGRPARETTKKLKGKKFNSKKVIFFSFYFHFTNSMSFLTTNVIKRTNN